MTPKARTAPIIGSKHIKTITPSGQNKRLTGKTTNRKKVYEKNISNIGPDRSGRINQHGTGIDNLGKWQYLKN
jgi:hypothetical protein